MTKRLDGLADDREVAKLSEPISDSIEGGIQRDFVENMMATTHEEFDIEESR